MNGSSNLVFTASSSFDVRHLLEPFLNTNSVIEDLDLAGQLLSDTDIS